MAKYLNVDEHRIFMNDYVKSHPDLVERWTKRADIINILFPALTVKNFGLFALFIKALLITAENSDGQFYEPSEYRILARIVKGKVLFPTNGDPNNLRVDSYAWENAVVKENLSKSVVKSLNVDTEEGVKNVEELLATIKDDEHRELLRLMFFRALRGDVLSVAPPAEKRYCMTVTEELMKSFPDGIVDRWVSADENGLAPATNLELGDRIIIVYEDDGTVTTYRCEKDIFFETHFMGH